MTSEEIEAWFKAERRPILSRDDAVLFLNSMHPRTVFVKALPQGACLLDVGAGDGGLEVIRRWPPPARADLRMYAHSLEKGAHFDAYDGYELGDWESGPPAFSAIQCNAVFCAQFIQHIADPQPFLRWAAQRLPAGGRLYLEWPSPFSALLPKKADLAKKGINLMISNFQDDSSHKAIHDRSRIVGGLVAAGFFIEQQGYLSLPFFEEEILAHRALGLDDAYAVQIAFWSRTKWAQYLVAVRK